MLEVCGLGGFIMVVRKVWAILSIVGSAASTGGKVLWVILILLLPVPGFIIGLIAAPRSAGRIA